jgi:adenine phosphoribosyltransferase
LQGTHLISPLLFHDLLLRLLHQSYPVYRNVRLDARGFVLGPPVALALQKPFIMMRKQGKMPNTISSTQYQTEYGNREGLTVQRDKILPGQRVLIIDDLVATGGTLSSAISLVKMLEGVVVECACIVELKMFVNPSDESGIPSRNKLMEALGHADVPIWGLISEDILVHKGEVTEDYVDDGEEH